VGGHFRCNQAAALTPARWRHAWHGDLTSDGPNTHGRARSSMGLGSKQSGGDWDSYAGRFISRGCVEVVLKRWLPFSELGRRWAAPPVHLRLQGKVVQPPRNLLMLLPCSNCSERRQKLFHEACYDSAGSCVLWLKLELIQQLFIGLLVPCRRGLGDELDLVSKTIPTQSG
jgi:hypothetical protein